MENTDKKYKIVLVTHSHSHRKGDSLKYTVKARDVDWIEATAVYERLRSRALGGFASSTNMPDYRILDELGFTDLLRDVRRDEERRRAEGVKKAAKTREKNAAKGIKRAPPLKVACPQCSAKSKLLRSEFGGLQTRQCTMGHQFTFDKWIADRAFWAPATAIRAVYGKAT